MKRNFNDKDRLPFGEGGLFVLVPVVGISNAAKFRCAQLAAQTAERQRGKREAELQFAGFACGPLTPKKKPPARGGFLFEVY